MVLQSCNARNEYHLNGEPLASEMEEIEWGYIVDEDVKFLTRINGSNEGFEKIRPRKNPLYTVQPPHLS